MSSTVQESDREPADRLNLVYLVFLLQGVGTLVPWNAFLSAGDFFDSLYCGFPFEFALGVAYNYPSIIFFILAIFWGARFHFTTRIYTSLGLNLLSLVLTPLVHYVFPVPARGFSVASLGLTLSLVVLTGAACSIYFGAMLGLAALFPHKYTGAIMIGNGIAGLIVVALRILTKLSLSGARGQLLAGSIYFYLSAGIIGVCFVGFFAMTRTKFYRFHIDRYELNKDTQGNVEGAPLLASPGLPKASVLTIFKKIWKEALIAFIVFFITILLYPGVTSLILPHCKSGQEGSDCQRDISSDWFTIIMITLFMVGDFIGRTGAGNWTLGLNNKTLWIPNILRLAFIPLFLVMVVPRAGPFIQNDWVAFVVMFLFAVSNGYTGTLAMIFGPDPAEEHEKEQAGIIMSFSLNFGIFLASNGALLVLYLLTGESIIVKSADNNC